jgi:uncharacterized protein YkwD/chitodextrinase
MKLSAPVLLTLFLSYVGISHTAHAQTITHQVSLPSGMSWCSDSMINGLFTQINALRVQKGLAALSMSALGMKDAELRAVQFATYMATARPTDPGFNPHQGYDTTAASIGYNVISENLAFVATDPAYIVGSLWQDPLHLAAMLAPEANVAGVSCVYNNGFPYWTYEPGRCTGASCSGGSTPPPTPAPPPTPTPEPTPPPANTPTLDTEEWAFLALINNYRAQNGAGPLQVSARLQNAARWMSTDMAAKNYFSHTDSLGRSSGARIAAFGYTYSPSGENLAAGLASAADAFDGWLNACDPDASGACTYAHRRTMLGAGFAAIGIARAYGAASAYGWYWTTDFGGSVDQVITPPGGTSPPPPAAPVAMFTATPAGIAPGQAVSLAWIVTGANTVTIDNGIGAVGPSGSRVVNPTQTTTYTLTATNAGGSTVARATVTVAASSPGMDTTAPSAPVYTVATVRSATRIEIAWAASTDNTGVSGYQILRNGAALTTVGPATLSYADTAVSPGTTYGYTVKSFDAAGNYSTGSNSPQVTTPAAAGSGPCPPAAFNAFTGCYYGNLTLAGNPMLARTDSQVNFDWGAAPDPALPARFSVRWQGDFAFTGGSYRLTATVSDGIRVYVDDNLVLDEWRDQPPSVYTADRTISQGVHRITVEYYTSTGRATAHLTWQSSSPVTQRPAILSFAANPSAVTAGQPSRLSWSVNGASSIAIDNGVGDVTGLSSTTVSPNQTTTYRLTATNAAGSVTATAVVTVAAASDASPPTAPTLLSAVANGATTVDLRWSASLDNVAVAGYQILRNGSPLQTVSGATITYADAGAAPNTAYAYTVKAFDAAGNYSGASNAIAVTTPAASNSGTACGVPAVGAFTACYYSGTNLGGNPVASGAVGQINFDWGAGSPSPAVPAGNFSARWQGYFDFEFAGYTFVARASDGIRVYLDGRLLIDNWKDQPVTASEARPWITKGSHLITVEYYARTGSASAHLTWQK